MESSDGYALLLVVISIAVGAFLVLLPIALIRGIIRGRTDRKQGP